MSTTSSSKRLLPGVYGEGQTGGLDRQGRYGENYSLPLVVTRHMLADEGSYYVATNPTIGTGIQVAANVTAFSDTAPMFLVNNNASVASGIRVYLDYVKLLPTGTLPTGTTWMDFAVKLDSVSRQTSAANKRTALTAANVNMDDSRAASALVYSYANASAMDTGASGVTARTVSRCRIPTSLGIAGDEYEVQFGAPDRDSAIAGLTAVRAAAPARLITHAAPIVLGPQQWAVIYMWWTNAATTAATFEFELGWFER